MQQASDYEFELLKIIWSNGGNALYAQIMQELSAQGKNWTKNTIITLLSRLIEKGLITTNKIGHRNRYSAVFSEGEYQAAQTEAFLGKMYEGNAKGLVATLIQKEWLSAADLAELNAYWQDQCAADEKNNANLQ